MNSFRLCIQGIVIHLSAVVILFDLAAGSVLVVQFFLIGYGSGEMNWHRKVGQNMEKNLPEKQARTGKILNKS